MSTDGTETTTWDNWEVATKRLPFEKQVEAGPFRVRLVEIRTNGLGTYLEFVNDTSVIDITCATDLIGLEITADNAGVQ